MMEGHVSRVLELLHFTTDCQPFLWNGNEGLSSLSTARIVGQGLGEFREKCKHGKVRKE